MLDCDVDKYYFYYLYIYVYFIKGNVFSYVFQNTLVIS